MFTLHAQLPWRKPGLARSTDLTLQNVKKNKTKGTADKNELYINGYIKNTIKAVTVPSGLRSLRS